MGPASIESHYDEALAVPGVLDEIATGERDGVDGYVLACFGDPGLDAARELAGGPVVAIAEAGMKVATYLGRGFTVVTTLEPDRRPSLGTRRAATACQEFCRNVRACEIPVLELDIPGSPAREVITAECARAVAEDDCDVIVLGCAGMADLAGTISGQIGVPVVDGVAAATTMVQSLVAMGLTTSTRCEFARTPGQGRQRTAQRLRPDLTRPSRWSVAVQDRGSPMAGTPRRSLLIARLRGDLGDELDRKRPAGHPRRAAPGDPGRRCRRPARRSRWTRSPSCSGSAASRSASRSRR